MIEIVNGIIIITLIIIIYKYFEKSSYDVVMVKSESNGKDYLVRNLPDKQEASNLLGSLALKLEKLVNITTNDSMKKVLQKNISSCYFALDTNSYKQMIIVKKMDTIVFNKGTSNFAPMYYGSPTKLLFTYLSVFKSQAHVELWTVLFNPILNWFWYLVKSSKDAIANGNFIKLAGWK